MLKLNTLVDAAAAAAPFRTVRRFKFVFDLSTMFTSPTLRPPRIHRREAGRRHARATSLRKLISRDDSTMETMTSAIAKMPAAAAVGSNL